MDITVKEVKQRLDAGEKLILIDVREPNEHAAANIGGILAPLGGIMQSLPELEPYKNNEVIVYCRSGKRSGSAAAFLQSNGFANVRNMTGGMLAWKEEIDPTANVS